MSKGDTFNHLEERLRADGEYTEKRHLLEWLRYYDRVSEESHRRSNWCSALTVILGAVVVLSPDLALTFATLSVQIVFLGTMISAIIRALYCSEKRKEMIYRVNDIEHSYEQPTVWRWFDALFRQKN